MSQKLVVTYNNKMFLVIKPYKYDAVKNTRNNVITPSINCI